MANQSNKSGGVLRWIGAMTAVLSLIFGVQQLMKAVGESNARERKLAESKQLAHLQLNNGEYGMAWESVDAALKSAEANGTFAELLGGLDEETAELRTLREDIAMAWVDDMHISGDQKFSDFVIKLLPALEQGAIASESQRKADLLAHIGWSSFLRYRDGTPTNPQRSYEQALQIDKENPYANAYLAHWMIWNGADVADARRHFDTALAGGRAKEKVRTLQVAAFGNRQTEEGDSAYVATVVSMLKDGEKADPKWQSRAWWHLTRACTGTGNTELLSALKSSLAPGTLVEAYEMLHANGKENESVKKKVASCLSATK